MADDPWLLEALLDQSSACQWIVDRQQVICAVYGSAASLFGKPASKLRGQPLSRVFDGLLAEAWAGRLERVFAGETLMLRERRSESIWYISVFPIRRGEEILYAGVLAREITPWGTAELELRHTVLGALKTQEFDRRMASQFLHDSVGQNLTALGLQLDLVRMDLDTTAPESSAHLAEIQKMLETMMEQVREYSYAL